MFLTLAIPFLIFTYLYFVWKENCRKWEKYGKIPGPPGNYFLGHAKMAWKSPEDIFETLRKHASEYSPIYKQWSLGLKIVHLLHPEDIKIFVANGRHIRNYKFIQSITGNSVLTLEGSKYHYRRKILSPAFGSGALRNFVQTFNEKSEKIDRSTTDEDKISNTLKYTVSCVKDTLIGKSVDISEDDLFKKIKLLHEAQTKNIVTPWIYQNFTSKITSMGKQLQKNINEIYTIIDKVIDHYTKEIKEDGSKTDPAQESAARILTQAKLDGAYIDNAAIRSEIMTFFIAGADTVTFCINMTLLCLANHEDIQQEVYKEMQSVFGYSKKKPSYDDLKKLTFMDQCINESLRLFPPISLFNRKTIYECESSTGYLIPEATTLVVRVFDLHRNPEVYPDPDKFKPERFTPENSQARHPFAFIPFGVGSRTCIGKKFALLSIKAYICNILTKYELKPVDTLEGLVLRYGLVLSTKNPVRIRFVRRGEEVA